MILLGALVAAWLLFNWLAPFAVLSSAEPLSLGRMPPDLVSLAANLRACVYLSNLAQPGGFSVLAWPRTLVVFDRTFFARATPAQVRFLIAHELGHVALGHLRWRWLATVTGACLLPSARRRLASFEVEADAYAEQLTGLSPQSFYQR